MKKAVWLSGILLLTSGWLMAQTDAKQSQTHVSGLVKAGLSTELNNDCDRMNLHYNASDSLLGTGSGHRYFSDVNDVSRNLHALYGADLTIAMQKNHILSLSLEGTTDFERAFGKRTEYVLDKDGQQVSRVHGTYNHPNELQNELKLSADYTYRLRRPGETFSVGYQYRWENENAGVDQEIEESMGWSQYTRNVLEQKINYHYHHAHLDYCYPVAKGHLLDFGLAYDRRELSVRTEQEWDEVRILDTDYRHLTQYGGVHARYRLRLGPVEAMARLEYRATRMQQRWLHDVLPTATIRYHIDTVHSLSAFYTIVLIRPEAQHLDSTRIEDAYTRTFGSDRLVGIHVHNVALTYRMKMDQTDFSTELRYLTTNDGFNAIWMERGDKRIYTWGNEGVRHAVSLTPKVESALGHTTKLHASATVMWDKRVAGAIHLENPNWGLRSNLRIDQLLFHRPSSSMGQVPLDLNLVMRGDYSYHNTLDVYSYAGHGGSLGADLKLNIRSLSLSLSYSSIFKSGVYITQGAYMGQLIYLPGATHELSLNLSYRF